MTHSNPAQTILFFDGVCHLCNNLVDQLIAHDKQHRLFFAPLQGETSSQILPEDLRRQIDTVVLCHQGKLYLRSDAIIKAISLLGGFYTLTKVLSLVPRFLRDFLYNWIAKNRYLWWGKRDFCRIPAQSEKPYLLP